jgi:uncharacterized protein YoaH (UPF0181 family)
MSAARVDGRVLPGEKDEGGDSRWYNPKTRTSETVPAPRTEEEAEGMLRGHRDSGAFLTRFEQLRADGMSVEQAMIFVGHHIRMRHLEFRPAR